MSCTGLFFTLIIDYCLEHEHHKKSLTVDNMNIRLFNDSKNFTEVRSDVSDEPGTSGDVIAGSRKCYH